MSRVTQGQSHIQPWRYASTIDLPALQATGSLDDFRQLVHQVEGQLANRLDRRDWKLVVHPLVFHELQKADIPMQLAGFPVERRVDIAQERIYLARVDRAPQRHAGRLLIDWPDDFRLAFSESLHMPGIPWRHQEWRSDAELLSVSRVFPSSDTRMALSEIYQKLEHDVAMAFVKVVAAVAVVDRWVGASVRVAARADDDRGGITYEVLRMRPA